MKDARALLMKNDGGKQVKKVPGVTTFKRHKGCSFCILDVENAPLPEFPPNQVAVGVITMEDVIEELLKVYTRHILIFHLKWQLKACGTLSLVRTKLIKKIKQPYP